VGGGSVFRVIHCGSFYDKYNELPMDEDAIRRKLEHSGDDEDYLSDLDEEFRDLSSEEDNGLTRYLGLNHHVRKQEFVSEHCQWTRMILERKLVWKGQRDM
jgi:hypothetical protein